MSYTPTVWQDKPNTTTPITAVRLNKLENGLASVAAVADAASAEISALGTSGTPLYPTLASIGDSLTAPNSSIEGVFRAWRESWTDIGNIIAGGVWDYIGASAFGGITIETAEADYLPAIIEASPDYCLVLLGANNLVNGLEPSERATLLDIYDQLDAAGIRPIVATLYPVSVDPLVLEINQWLKQVARERGYLLFDTYPHLVNPVTGTYFAGDSDDSVHLTGQGALRIAKAFADWSKRFLASETYARDNLVNSPADPRPNGDSGLLLLHDAGLPQYWVSITAGAPTVTAGPVGNRFNAEKTDSSVRYQVNCNEINVSPNTTYRFTAAIDADVEQYGGSWTIELLDVAGGYAAYATFENLIFDVTDGILHCRFTTGATATRMLPVIKVMGGPNAFSEADGVGSNITISQITLEAV